MKNKKLTLNALKVNSFVTSLNNSNKKTVAGGGLDQFSGNPCSLIESAQGCVEFTEGLCDSQNLGCAQETQLLCGVTQVNCTQQGFGCQ